MLSPCEVQGSQPLGDALRVVDAIDANAELTRVLRISPTQRLHTQLTFGSLRHFLVLVEVDADRKGGDLNGAILKTNCLISEIDVGVGNEFSNAVEKLQRMTAE